VPIILLKEAKNFLSKIYSVGFNKLLLYWDVAASI